MIKTFDNYLKIFFPKDWEEKEYAKMGPGEAIIARAVKQTIANHTPNSDFTADDLRERVKKIRNDQLEE